MGQPPEGYISSAEDLPDDQPTAIAPDNDNYPDPVEEAEVADLEQTEDENPAAPPEPEQGQDDEVPTPEHTVDPLAAPAQPPADGAQ